MHKYHIEDNITLYSYFVRKSDEIGLGTKTLVIASIAIILLAVLMTVQYYSLLNTI